MEADIIDILYEDTPNNYDLLQRVILAHMCSGLSKAEMNRLIRLDSKYFTEEYKKLFKAIQTQYRTRGKVDRVILAEQLGAEYNSVKAITTDTGSTGKPAADYAKSLINRYRLNRVNFIYANYSSQDIKDAAKLSEEIQKANDECKQELALFDDLSVFDNVAEYMISTKGLAADVLEFKNNSGIKTGFNELDIKTFGGLHAGLYVLGAASSLGKTTFTHQIADQIAESGNKVLFFSMEQSRLEMVSKSISRSLALAHRNDPKRCQSSFYVRKHMFDDPNIGVQIAEYSKKTAPNMHIIEGSFDTTVDYIKNYVSDFIDAHDGLKPVVFVDYLQIIQVPGDKSKMTTKEATDYNVTELKRLSSRFNIPVIVISSLNRQNYLSQIDFESFKESGGIEYTADVVLGLQLSVMHDKIFDNEKGEKNTKRQKVLEAKKEIPRKIELVCLKNRFGVCSFSLNYLYYPQYDVFIEAKTAEVKVKKAI